MYTLWLLFGFQTLLLCLAALVSDSIRLYVLGIDMVGLVNMFRIERLHQIINLLFLLSIGFKTRKRIRNMLLYVTTRRSVATYTLLLIYLGLLIVYLELITSIYLYKYFLFPVVAASLIYWPYLFEEDAIKNPKGLIENELNFSLLGEDGQLLPIELPQAGIFIVGAPGCGKTKCVVEPILFKMLQKGYAGVLYDYDFSAEIHGKNYSLTHLAYNCFTKFKTGKGQFVSINFQDLSRSARINPIDYESIQDRKRLSSCIKILLLNLSPHLAQKEDFWYKNSYALLKSIIVYLCNNYPAYCTLPHAILLGLEDHSILMELLQTDREARLYASPILDAYKQAPEQFAGVMANFKVLLEGLLDKNLFWVLSGNEMPLVVNDPENPLVVCLGNTPTEKGIISPILSMIMAVLIANMYGHGRHKSFLAIDELPTILLPNLNEVPATARKYDIATIVAMQNIPQLEKAYTDVGAREIQETFSNHFIGRGSFGLSKSLSDMIGKKDTEAVSTTKSEKHVSETVHQKESMIISPQDAMTLKTGEFMGKVVHESGSFFKMQLKPIQDYSSDITYQNLRPLPTREGVIDVEANYEQITSQIAEIASKN
ncbi:MAG: type IV secretory system conjugative DNA transfer family protein [Candidatus Amoebophilus sp.]